MPFSGSLCTLPQPPRKTNPTRYRYNNLTSHNGRRELYDNGRMRICSETKRFRSSGRLAVYLTVEWTSSILSVLHVHLWMPLLRRIYKEGAHKLKWETSASLTGKRGLQSSKSTGQQWCVAGLSYATTVWVYWLELFHALSLGGWSSRMDHC